MSKEGSDSKCDHTEEEKVAGDAIVPKYHCKDKGEGGVS